MNINIVVKFQGKASVESVTDVSPSVESINGETEPLEIRGSGDENNGCTDRRTVNIQFCSRAETIVYNYIDTLLLYISYENFYRKMSRDGDLRERYRSFTSVVIKVLLLTRKSMRSSDLDCGLQYCYFSRLV